TYCRHMAITQIRTMTLFVSDQERAKAFYVDRLGFDVRTDQAVGENRWLEVVPPKGGTAVVLHRPFPGTSPVRGTGSSSSPTTSTPTARRSSRPGWPWTARRRCRGAGRRRSPTRTATASC